jgi:hypothetical protein
MVANALLDETRDARMKLGIAGVVEQLRAPETVHRLLMEQKPTTTSLGDFALKAMLDAALIAAIMRGDYRTVNRLVVTVFGDAVTERTGEVTDVTRGDEAAYRKPLHRSAAR